MLRLPPPHLLVLVALLVLVVWIMLVRQIRRSAVIQRFVAEAFGDDSPQGALVAFEQAKDRLAEQLKHGELDSEMRRQIEHALGVSPVDPSVE